MEFRWVAAITLWTMLAGPVFVKFAMPPSPQAASSLEPAAVSQTWSAETVQPIHSYTIHGSE